ncbi:unnamed protein product [Cylindrotheca closterium]|uniref:Reverse transcriptase Ty1/copia-type domain-containing protein n=1 Tax=Cylindrotheca closterium TaxID=2856 RepID=A0AAD2CLE4_9STRA|nr:unnamed protein product [Cylindrotheca closterium]
MRKKARLKRLRISLYQAVASKVKSRKKGEFWDKNVLSTEAGRKITERAHNSIFQQSGTEKKATYNVDESLVISRVIQQICDEIFKERGKEAALKELDQLIKRSCWTPTSIGELNESKKRKAVDAMMLLAEKNSGDIKGCFVYKGNETRDWLSREDTASPTASHEGICCTGVIDAHKGRCMMSMDIPNAFTQTLMPDLGDGEDRVIMKVTGLMVQYMIDLDPTYCDCVVYENGKRVIYVVILCAIYGMLQALLLWYRILRASLEEYGFVFN